MATTAEHGFWVAISNPATLHHNVMKFELSTQHPCPVDDAVCEGIFRWATGKKGLSHRLPKLQ